MGSVRAFIENESRQARLGGKRRRLDVGEGPAPGVHVLSRGEDYSILVVSGIVPLATTISLGNPSKSRILRINEPSPTSWPNEK